jgi:hypothetical protein
MKRTFRAVALISTLAWVFAAGGTAYAQSSQSEGTCGADCRTWIDGQDRCSSYVEGYEACAQGMAETMGICLRSIRNAVGFGRASFTSRARDRVRVKFGYNLVDGGICGDPDDPMERGLGKWSVELVLERKLPGAARYRQVATFALPKNLLSPNTSLTSWPKAPVRCTRGSRVRAVFTTRFAPVFKLDGGSPVANPARDVTNSLRC